MLERLKQLWTGASARVEPQYDASVRRKLEAEGKNLSALIADPAEPTHIPEKPLLVGFSGRVCFQMTLNAEGEVQAVQMEGAPFKEVAKLEAWAYAWSFRPALLDGKPHPCRMTFEVHWS